MSYVECQMPALYTPVEARMYVGTHVVTKFNIPSIDVISNLLNSYQLGTSKIAPYAVASQKSIHSEDIYF